MPRRGELISHAGRVNTAIHQVQEENNRAEAVREKPPDCLPSQKPQLSLASFLNERTQEQIQDKREEINFLAEKCGHDVGYPSYLYILDGGRNERGERDEEQRQRRRDEGFYSRTLTCAKGTSRTHMHVCLPD